MIEREIINKEIEKIEKEELKQFVLKYIKEHDYLKIRLLSSALLISKLELCPHNKDFGIYKNKLGKRFPYIIKDLKERGIIYPHTKKCYKVQKHILETNEKENKLFEVC